MKSLFYFLEKHLTFSGKSKSDPYNIMFRYLIYRRVNKS